MTRTAEEYRKTLETEVRVTIDLDGSGRTDVSTGVGFFDHLLTSFAHHGMFDLVVETAGDLEIDEHHTVEDTSLVLGTAIASALGDRTGLNRFGEATVPMDEALARVALDAGGRPYAVIDVEFRSERLGALPTQLVPHSLESLARTAGLTVHVSAHGANDHHVAEAVFKALGRALRAAATVDPARSGVASTKGAV